MNDFLKFSLILLALLLSALALHLFILKGLELPLWDNKILLAYTVNYILAIAIYGTLYLLQEKMTSQLGFLYMGGSLLKFLFFFVLFYPSYKLDGDMSNAEFAAFFIPYSISLILETSGIIKFLKK
ncbi:MAG: DUF6168 family protein [Lutimonas sp.]